MELTQQPEQQEAGHQLSGNNLHAPQRLEGESFRAYRERREQSRKAAARITGRHLNGGIGSREQFRNSMRSSGTMGKRIRAYAALMAAWASKRVTPPNLRDEHGAYTLTGSVYQVEGDGVEPTSRECVLGGGVGGGMPPSYTLRRKWLAGISAQRGY